MQWPPDVESLWPVLRQWSYLLIFLVAFLECFPIVGTIVPGGFVLVAAGFAATTGHLEVTFVLCAAAAGAILGDAGAFEVGHRLGHGVVSKYRGRTLMPESMVRKTEEAVANHTGITIVGGRFNSFTRAIAPMLAGCFRIPRGRFYLWNVVGGVGWAAIHALGGYFFGKGFLLLFEQWGTGAVVLVIVLLIIWWGWKKYTLLRSGQRTVRGDEPLTPELPHIELPHIEPPRIPERLKVKRLRK